jgi:hypothetical protein
MSQENVDRTRHAIEHFNRTGGWDYSVLDPGTVFDLSRSPFPDAGVYRGLDGVRAWFKGLADAFGQLHYEVEEIRDVASMSPPCCA